MSSRKQRFMQCTIACSIAAFLFDSLNRECHVNRAHVREVHVLSHMVRNFCQDHKFRLKSACRFKYGKIWITDWIQVSTGQQLTNLISEFCKANIITQGKTDLTQMYVLLRCCRKKSVFELNATFTGCPQKSLPNLNALTPY